MVKLLEEDCSIVRRDEAFSCRMLTPKFHAGPPMATLAMTMVQIKATREAYRRFTENGSTGTDIDGLKLHRELVETTGLSALLDLERRTTEIAASEEGTR